MRGFDLKKRWLLRNNTEIDFGCMCACLHVRVCVHGYMCVYMGVGVCHVGVMQEVKTRCISITYFNLGVEDSLRADLEYENGPIKRSWV